MTRALVAAFILVASFPIVRAQTQPSSVAPVKYVFDVAAIKQNTSGSEGGQFGGPPSRFTATNVPALRFITFAYRVQDFLLEGAPDWLKTDRWDINAKADGQFAASTIDGPEVRRDMLRALLVDRFKLAAHSDTRERPIYALVIAQAGQPRSPRRSEDTADDAGQYSRLRYQ